MQQSQASLKFKGPLFIVGMPRSGTKLLRALLNQHPFISITLAESHFIPYFVHKFGSPPQFKSKEDLYKLVKTFLNTPFFRTMQNKHGYCFDAAEFINQVDHSCWSSIFEWLFKNFGSKRQHDNVIWGDKTPGYLNHLPLLKDIFPSCRFIHMMRDPRDYCLSVKKSWGKNIYRAAYRWQETVGRACIYGRACQQDYLEIHYENLLGNPEQVMKSVAAFLECEYDKSMTEIGLSHEDVGETKGKYGIVTNNTNKYISQLSQKEIKKIEEIVCKVANSVDYPIDNNIQIKYLNRGQLAMFKIYDGFASINYHVQKENNLQKGLKYFISHYTKSSWR
jgi:hypothetical protein